MITWWKDRQEKALKQKLQAKENYLNTQFKKIPSNQKFAALELFDAMSFRVDLRVEDAFDYLNRKETENLVSKAFHLKCPKCNLRNREVRKSDVEEHQDARCRGCQFDFVISEDTTFIVFQKI